MTAPKVLATDLDGTFIPLENDFLAQSALTQIRELRSQFANRLTSSPTKRQQIEGQNDSMTLLFVTGRHFESVIDAIGQFDLPVPDWILCDVGTSIYRRLGSSPDSFVRVDQYDQQLDHLVAQSRTEEVDIEKHRQAIGRLPLFRLQESFKQGNHKLSYFVPAPKLDESVQAIELYVAQQRLNYGIISSIDPFNGDGLVDVLPRGVSKAYALDWWRCECSVDADEIIFCGDSGNDFAALVAGYRAAIVGNADRALADHVSRVHRDNRWDDRLLLSPHTSTSGVLHAMQWFGMFKHELQNEPCNHSTRWGSTLIGHRQTRFRCYAPAHEQVAVEILHKDDGPEDHASSTHRIEFLQSIGNGWFESVLKGVPAGTMYRYRLSQTYDSLHHPPEELQPVLGDGIPDPASRFQPNGVHGPSMVVDPSFAWKHDAVERPRHIVDLVLYELHVGTFTSEGTFNSAVERLDELVELGITAIEMMPIAACPGRWNWGYDATHWFAPMAALGTPDDFRRFVDECHQRGLAVLLDVVYNHFGPEGNYLSLFGHYLSTRHPTAWGAGPNFDDPVIRRFVIDNALMWLDEYHLDGLRVDAIHCMGDDSEEHITQQMGREIRQWAATQDRRIWLIAETNVYDEQMTVAIESGGSGFDAQWCDDYLHSVFANLRPGEQLTTRVYRPQSDLAETLKRGFVFSGNVRGYRGRQDAEELHQPVDRNSQVICIQNHDFIGNHPLGKRLHLLTSPASQAAAATLTLMMPCIPMIFMGEEFACDRPFQFFVDFSDDELKKAVVQGRMRDYPQHDWSDGILPIDPAAMTQSKIGPAENGNPIVRSYYQSVLKLRRQMIDSGRLRAELMNVIADEELSLYRIEYGRGVERLVVVAHLLPFVAEDSERMHDLSSELLQDLPVNLILDSQTPFGSPGNGWTGQHVRVYS